MARIAARQADRLKERGETPVEVSTQKTRKRKGGAPGASNLGIGPNEGKYKKSHTETTKLSSINDI